MAAVENHQNKSNFSLYLVKTLRLVWIACHEVPVAL